MIRRVIYWMLVGLFLAQILFVVGIETISRLIAILPPVKSLKRKFRAGNLVSRLIRPVVESRWIRAIFGANLATAMIVGSVGIPVTDYHNFLEQRPPVIEQALAVDTQELVVTTEKFEYTLPVEELIGISTRYRGGHRGYDFRAPLGSGVRPILGGRVVSIIHAKYGYGRHVYVDHGNGLISMYAHLGKIKVEEGDNVTRDTILGEIGLTGWTTGPHLHFEVYENGEAINPGFLFDL